MHSLLWFTKLPQNSFKHVVRSPIASHLAKIVPASQNAMESRSSAIHYRSLVTPVRDISLESRNNHCNAETPEQRNTRSKPIVLIAVELVSKVISQMILDITNHRNKGQSSRSLSTMVSVLFMERRLHTMVRVITERDDGVCQR